MPTHQQHTSDARHRRHRKDNRLPKALSRLNRPKPRLRVSMKTAQRIAELDETIGTAQGVSIANVILGDVIRDVIEELAEGRIPGIVNHWNWDSQENQGDVLKRLAQRWAREDGREEDSAA